MCPSPQIEATHGELNVVDHAYQDLLQENQRLHRQGNSYHFRWYQNKSASFNKRFLIRSLSTCANKLTTSDGLLPLPQLKLR